MTGLPPSAELPQQSVAETAVPAQPPEQSRTRPTRRDEDVIRRLAELTPMDYDRVRREEAKKLGVQLQTLDDSVKAARRPDQETSASVLFPTVEAWPEPVIVADLLTAVAETIKRFVILDPYEVTACALWVAHTYLVNAFEHSPLLLVDAPERACGKTLLQDVLARVSYRPLPAANATLSSLFRAIEKWQPTIFLDEADTFFRDNHDLHGMVNAGHRRGGTLLRSEAVGDNFEPRQFSVYCAKSLAGIALEKHLSDATLSRGVVLHLRRKLPHETVERLRHAAHGVFEVLKSQLVRFAEDYAKQIRQAKPPLPDALNDRDQDNWEPLLAIAQCAGSEWLERATAAALKLSLAGDTSGSIGNELLADIEEVFATEQTVKWGQPKTNVTKLSSSDLIAALVKDEEAPWAAWNRGRPITPRQLAKLLSPYGIKPKTVRQGHDTPKGYDIAQFADAFARYHRPASPELPPRRHESPEPLPGKETGVADAAVGLRNASPNPPRRNAPPGGSPEAEDVAANPPRRNAAATPAPLPGKESGDVAAKPGESAKDYSAGAPTAAGPEPPAAGPEPPAAAPEPEGVAATSPRHSIAATPDPFWDSSFGAFGADAGESIEDDGQDDGQDDSEDGIPF